MTIYKLTGTTVQDNVASLDIQEDGVMDGVLMAMTADLDADGEVMSMEVSFSSTSGFATNDTRASIAGCAIQNGLLTSGAINGAVNIYVPIGMTVSGGERVYLHTSGTAAAIGRVSAWIYVADSFGAEQRRARERRGGRP